MLSLRESKERGPGDGGLFGNKEDESLSCRGREERLLF